jgi:TRAP-type C4-dicarboxylate transport system permease small subunit
MPGCSGMRALVDRAVAAAEGVAAAVLAVVTALTFISVLLRYFLSWSIPDSYDLSRNLLGILIFWSIAIAGFRGDHIVVDLVWSALPAGGRRALDLLGTIFTFACMAVFAWAVADKVTDQFHSGETTYDLHLPVWPFTLLAWLGLVASVLLLAVRFGRQVGSDVADSQARPGGH